MSVHSPDRPNAQWMADTGPAPVRLLLAGVEGEANELVGTRISGFPLELVIVDTAQPIDDSVLAGAAAAVVQVTEGDDRSIARFKKLAEGPVPLIGAAYEPTMKLVRALVRAGAHDVVPLPLDPEELETALDPIRRMVGAHGARARVGHQKIVTIIKSEGGVGATALLCQMATRFAAGEAAAGREACLIDLDVQFGDAALHLGLQPPVTFTDLVEAGKRLDGELMRSVATRHSSGLRLISAPREIMPLESLTSDQLLTIMDLATAEFGTVFVDLPTNWTNWSMSLLARSDVVLLVTELRVPSLHQAWAFSSVANGGAGDFTGTPIVADGCMYIASTRGWVFAVNADTGKLVWKAQVPHGGGVNSTVAVADRLLPKAAKKHKHR